jgi:gliding motility associated protien GldN
MKRKIILSITGIFISLCLYAQDNMPGEKPGPPYKRTELAERKVIQYPPLREADVIYAKRIERIIDVREKKNLVMNWPKSALNKIIYDLVLTGEPTESGKLRAYRTDSLSNAMLIQDIRKVGCDINTIQIHDPNAPDSDIYATIDKVDTTLFDPSTIKRWKIVEEWIFDKQRSMFFPRIIALAPLFQPNLNGVLFPEQPMFYISYLDARQFLANTECFNRQNDAMRFTFYDFFEQRLFSSYITKENNDKDFAIKDFDEFKNNPRDALYDSERIKIDMMNWESDLWEY